VISYPLDALYEEMAFIAYYLHWPPDALVGLEHRERRRWVAEVSRINQELDDRARGD
jgi:hypothetical protein